MYIIIKSNNGNHTGFNRTWTLLREYLTRQEAFSLMVDYSFCDDNYVYRNGRAWDSYNKYYIFTNNMDSFMDGLTTYKMIHTSKLREFFNGGSNGYLPNWVKEFIN